jgi:hypothetical protein
MTRRRAATNALGLPEPQASATSITFRPGVHETPAVTRMSRNPHGDADRATDSCPASPARAEFDLG